MEPAGVDYCTEFPTIESCYFNGGQIVRYSDGAVLITGVWTYRAWYNGGADTDSDVDVAAFTFVVTADHISSWQRLHPTVARGAGYKSVFLTFDRATDKFRLVYDDNDDGEPSATDPVLKEIVVTDM
jgi:hypothetical protein